MRCKAGTCIFIFKARRKTETFQPAEKLLYIETEAALWGQGLSLYITEWGQEGDYKNVEST